MSSRLGAEEFDLIAAVVLRSGRLRALAHSPYVLLLPNHNAGVLLQRQHRVKLVVLRPGKILDDECVTFLFENGLAVAGCDVALYIVLSGTRTFLLLFCGPLFRLSYFPDGVTDRSRRVPRKQADWLVSLWAGPNQFFIAIAAARYRKSHLWNHVALPTVLVQVDGPVVCGTWRLLPLLIFKQLWVGADGSYLSADGSFDTGAVTDVLAATDGVIVLRPRLVNGKRFPRVVISDGGARSVSLVGDTATLSHLAVTDVVLRWRGRTLAITGDRLRSPAFLSRDHGSWSAVQVLDVIRVVFARPSVGVRDAGDRFDP